MIAAKTVFIDNQTGYTQITDKAYEALSKWGRYKIVKDAKDADLVLRFTADNQDRPTQPEEYRSIAYPHSPLRTRPNE